MLRVCSHAPVAVAGLVIGLSSVPAFAAEMVLDFETDDFGTPLVNGQSISTFPDAQDAKGNFDTVFEFGNVVNISTIQNGTDGHEGAAIFDSTTGVNYEDDDLWVNKGNILIIQNDAHPATVLDPTYGLRFTRPDDEKSGDDRGTIVFDFLQPSEMISMDLIDFNGGSGLQISLIDSAGDMRVYNVPSKWTTDPLVAPVGWQTLMLDTLDPQPSEPNATGDDAIVIQNDAGFEPGDVMRMEVLFTGFPCSGAIDNVRFHLPEPATLVLIALAGLPFFRRCRR
jgi:hypothetical protein